MLQKETWPLTRLCIAEALWRMAKHPAAVPGLLEVLKDQNEWLRADAAAALGRIGPEAKAAVRPLADALRDEKARVRIAAAQALGAIGAGPGPRPRTSSRR